MIIDPIADPTAYPAAADIVDTLTDLAQKNADICTLDTTTAKTVAGTPIAQLRIAQSASPTVVVYVTGGVHAREWAPPLALTRFCQTLLQAAGPAGSRAAQVVRYPPFVRPATPVQPGDIVYKTVGPRPTAQFPAVTVDQPGVKSIFSALDIRIVPLVNVDGYEWSRTQPGQKYWRKNRHNFGSTTPCTFLQTLDFSVGTDLNRNTDANWDVDKYYAPGFYDIGFVQTAKDACGTPIAGATPGGTARITGQEYRGPGEKSEPETSGMLGLIDAAAPTYFVDIHSTGPRIFYGWASALHQSTDDTKNFQNSNLDKTRDGRFAEYVPAPLLGDMKTIAMRMAEGIQVMKTADASAALGDTTLQSTYRVLEGARLVRATGDLQSHVMKANYGTAQPPEFHIPVVDPPRYAYTIECGTERSRFHPLIAVDYIKIEREIHLALWALLSVAASPFKGGVKLPIHT
jgi:hypothetical protein